MSIPSALVGAPYVKMNGLGNDFVIVDLRTRAAEMTSAAAAAIADRNKGIGCDQVITVEMDNCNPDPASSKFCALGL